MSPRRGPLCSCLLVSLVPSCGVSCGLLPVGSGKRLWKNEYIVVVVVVIILVVRDVVSREWQWPIEFMAVTLGWSSIF